MKVKILFLISVISFSPIATAGAADCEIACVDVYTQDGQLIFEARKGSGPKASTAPKPKPKPVVKPKVAVKPKVIVPPKVATKPRVVAPKKKVPMKGSKY